jgi:ribosome-binding protein aMBF1 (putative translation factor)
MRCNLCGSEIRRPNVLGKLVLCDECYAKSSSEEGPVCAH